MRMYAIVRAQSSKVQSHGFPCTPYYFPSFQNSIQWQIHRPLLLTTISSLSSSRRSSSFTTPRCQKMYVPGFGEASPETKAATNLHDFFIYLVVKIVLAQLESYNPEAHEELMEFISRNSLNKGDKFCAKLTRESSRHQALVVADLFID